MKRSPADKPHLRLHHHLYDSHAFSALTPVEARVWLSLRRRCGPTNNGDLSMTLADARHAGISSSSTLAKALRALEAAGLIARTRTGTVAGGGLRTCSLYRFTDLAVLQMLKVPTPAMPATNEWEHFRTKAQVLAAIRSAHEAAKRPRENTSKDQKSNCADSKFEASSPISDSKIEHRGVATVRNSKRRNGSEIGLQPAPAMDSQHS